MDIKKPLSAEIKKTLGSGHKVCDDFYHESRE